MFCPVPQHGRGVFKQGYDGVYPDGKKCFCPREVHECHEIIGGDQVIYIRTQVIGKLPEDTGDFPLLFQLQFPDFIVCLDDFRGFDVRGFPGGGFVVHDSV